MHIYPDYYKDFRCIASRCTHNCCIGWEIDIDSNSLNFYDTVSGDFKKRLLQNISYDDPPHFILSENERCPFLNDHNLCDIIINLGENHICDICKEHPRFHNELPGRIESGLGLCCEEAARIILSKKDTVKLVSDKNNITEDEIIILRDEIMNILQDRNHSVKERLGIALSLCNTTASVSNIKAWCDVLLNLEQLDKNWGDLLCDVKESYDFINFSLFEKHMKEREHEYEQFVVYLLYRHFANAPDIYEAQNRIRFINFAYELLYALGATVFYKNGEFSLDMQIELTRLFSSEIEYSDENLYTLFDMV